MLQSLRIIFDWSEVWALLIPLVVMWRYKRPEAFLKPVRFYVVIALVINLASTLIWYRKKLGINLPDWLDSNSALYNAGSVARLIFFSWFFILLDQRFMHRLKKIIPFLFMAGVLINFIFFEDFYTHGIFSSRLLATEAALLLFYCLQYYIFLMIEDRETPLPRQPGFWIVTGLTFYVAISFFIFLFYSYLADEDLKFAIDIWDVHNVAYIFLCICLAINLYRKNEE